MLVFVHSAPTVFTLLPLLQYKAVSSGLVLPMYSQPTDLLTYVYTMLELSCSYIL